MLIRRPTSFAETCIEFRLFPFRSPLLRESHAIYFPLATEMFHFARSSLYSYEFTAQYPVKRDGFPHSDILGSKLAWELPGAYRTLQRPSSFFGVKASTVRP